MKNNNLDLNVYLPLSEITFSILTILSNQELHGYEIMKRVEKDISRSVPSPTLYRHIKKMLDDEFLEMVETANANSDDPRRKYYKMTDLGKDIYNAEYERMKKAVFKAEASVYVGSPVHGTNR